MDYSSIVLIGMIAAYLIVTLFWKNDPKHMIAIVAETKRSNEELRRNTETLERIAVALEKIAASK